MPVNETRAVQIIETSTRLTIREQRAFDRAERKIARGLKSFLEVGMALKEIRDKRLYRQEYDTFEEYCIRRWELSRPRAYELCAASEVVADLSAIADIRLPQSIRPALGRKPRALGVDGEETAKQSSPADAIGRLPETTPL